MERIKRGIGDKKIVCFAGWKPFRSAQTITGQWDLGQEGGGSGPGRNGRCRVEPIPICPGSTPHPKCTGLASNPAGQRRPPNSGRGDTVTICHLPGGRRPPGPDYVVRRALGDVG